MFLECLVVLLVFCPNGDGLARKGVFDEEEIDDSPEAIAALAAPRPFLATAPPGFTVTTIGTGLGVGAFIGLAADRTGVNPLVYFFESAALRLWSITDLGVKTPIGPPAGYAGIIGSIGFGEPFLPRIGPDGRLFVVSTGGGGRVWGIHLVTGVASVYGSLAGTDCSSGNCRNSIDFDSTGNLIFMAENSYPHRFYRINPHPTGATAATFLGITSVQPGNNHGDSFGIQHGTGDYVIFSDNCNPPQNAYAYIAAGHIDGTPFTQSWTSPVFTGPVVCVMGIGAIQPATGDVFTVPGSGSNQPNAFYTPFDGSTPVSDVFISGAVAIRGIAFKGCESLYLYSTPNGGMLERITGFACPLATE